MKNKLLFNLFAICVLIITMGFASAYDDIGTYKIDTPLNLNLGCSYNNTYCPSTFDCNITVYNKNGILINNEPMSEDLYPQFNYTLPRDKLNVTGLYYGRQVCCGAVGCADYSFQFEVNAQGKNYETIQGTIYAILFILLIGIFSLSLWASIKMPSGNIRNRDGELIKINWKKYLRFILFGVAYVCFLGITYFAWNISYGILEYTEMAGFFEYLYRVVMIMTIPIMTFLFVYGLIFFVNDKKVQRMLERGLTVK